MTKATETGPMAGKSKSKVARTAATEKALARKPKASKQIDPVRLATDIHTNLLSAQPKLDKVGARLEKALKAIMDGGDASNLSALEGQVNDHIANGTPAVMKSTSRGGGVKLSEADSKQIEDEAKSRNAGKITSVKSTSDGNYLAIAKGADSFVLPKTLETPEFKELATVGGSYAAAKKLADELIAKRPPARLATGIDGRNAPQSVAAHQAGKKASKPAEESKPAKAPKVDAKKEARKAERAEKAAPKADDKRAITVLKKDFAFGREGSARRASWDKVLKAKTVAAYITAGGAAKYLPRWQSAGAIKMG